MTLNLAIKINLPTSFFSLSVARAILKETTKIMSSTNITPSPSTSGSSNKGSQGKCTNCKKPPSEKKTSVNCDSCKRLFCGDCHGLSPTEVRVLELKTVVRVMTFLCSDCKSAMSQLPMIMKKLDELSDEVHKLRMRQSMLATESAVQEIAERANRANNIIMYDISESTSEEANERKEHDLSECSRIIMAVSAKVSCVGIKTFRLGAKSNSNDTGSPRPLKVILRSKSDALEVLSNRKKLAKPMSVKADLTPLQREYLHYLRDELNRRISEGENDITIKYIRGQPTIVETNKPVKN